MNLGQEEVSNPASWMLFLRGPAKPVKFRGCTFSLSVPAGKMEQMPGWRECSESGGGL